MIIVIKSEGRPFFHLFAPSPPETSKKLLYTYTWGLREAAQMCNITSRLSKHTIQYSHTIDLGYERKRCTVQGLYSPGVYGKQPHLTTSTTSTWSYCSQPHLDYANSLLNGFHFTSPAILPPVCYPLSRVIFIKSGHLKSSPSSKLSNGVSPHLEFCLNFMIYNDGFCLLCPIPFLPPFVLFILL